MPEGESGSEGQKSKGISRRKFMEGGAAAIRI